MRSINITSLFLDSKNPRHIPIENQKEIIKHMIEKEKVKELAKDITEKGMTNPLDLIGIVVENGKKIVLEGNRRVCALKLLNNPTLAPKKHQRYFEKLQQQMPEPIKTITVYHQFASRPDATPWLSTLHTASSKTSRKAWSPEQKTRFEQGVNGNPSNAAALTVLDFSLENNLISPEQSQKVITTITRMLSSPEVREAFGIVTGVKERNMLINITKEEFATILTQYFTDFDNPVHNIGSRSKKTDRLDYIKYLSQKGKIPSTRLEEPIALILGISSTEHSLANTSATQPVAPNKRIKKMRPGQIITYALSIPVSKIQSIYLEIKDKLNVYTTPYATAALLRALIEQSCDYFLTQTKGIQFHEKGHTKQVHETSTLREKILGIAQYLEKNNLLEQKELSTLTNECADKKDGTGTLNLLHSILHNYAHNINADQIISAHNNLKPFIIAIWEKYSWPNAS
ncbi:ParB N-terminal domain-containing protein [Actinobacillus equuli subsp. haemolyticus]|uniref:ParB N-terminal domain-containing protein n=1 Tax=Actinobacillus equuli TaxID=718 RepID=UPI002442CCB2|nr:ParB N-terminal domain-containing protein [Actinobacillus equuli]WGE81809.1 ParB N-terminal domain-containing protein [Actinobacillus equuli subsp. haemolyticus]